jgi:uncharacterized membrane protein YfhO
MVSYGDDKVEVRVVAERDAMLVLTDTLLPGWVARIDGRQTPLLSADYLFRTVMVPAGTHVVQFTYEPVSVALGAAMTLAACTVIIFVAVWHTVRVLRRCERPIEWPAPVRPRTERQQRPVPQLS